MSTIKQVYEVTKKLVEEGHGDVPIVCVDARSGVTDELSFYNGEPEVLEKDDNDYYGELEDRAPGYIHFKCYVG